MLAGNRSTRRGARRGVILLVVLGLLALFTLVTITFVVSSSQHRRGAVAAHRVEQLGDPPEALLNAALYQVIRGPRNPASVMGPHSLLEDIYGHSETVYGVVFPLPPNVAGITTAAGGQFIEIQCLSFGPDRQPGIANFDDDNNGVVDDISECNLHTDPSNDDTRLCRIPFDTDWGKPYAQITAFKDSIDNYYAGRVITFTTGRAAGLSTRIVRSFGSRYNSPDPFNRSPATQGGFLWIVPFDNGVTLDPADVNRFVINGAPFNGAGFGYAPGRIGNTLTSHDILLGSGPYEMALLPNPVDPVYQMMLNQNFGRLVQANEDYDIADYNNMLLASQEWDPIKRRWRTILPSLHRPDLVNYWVHRAHTTNPELLDSSVNPSAASPRWTDLKPAFRKRIILRPDPADHYDTAQDLDGGGWTPGEPYDDLNGNGQCEPHLGEWNAGRHDLNGNNAYDPPDPSFFNSDFDAVNGPWDVDNMGDGIPDSVWVDLGMPVQQTAQGITVKPLFAILVMDMDGRINLNAHGTHKHYLFEIDDPPESLGSGALITDERMILGVEARKLNWNSSRRLLHVSNPAYPVGGPVYPNTDLRSGIGGPYAGGWFVTTPARAGTSGGNLLRLFGVGQGWSPADVNLSLLLGITRPERGSGQRRNEYRWLLEGRIESITQLPGTSAESNTPIRQAPAVPGRYGETHWVEKSTPGSLPAPRAGVTHVPTYLPGPFNGNFSGDDNLPMEASRVVKGSNPHQFRGNASRNTYAWTDPGPDGVLGTADDRQVGDMGSPPDLDGDGFIGLDFRGQPYFYNMGYPGNRARGVAPETIDEPTEIDLSLKAQRRMPWLGPDGIPNSGDEGAWRGKVIDIDAPFTPADLDAILNRSPGGYTRDTDRLDDLGIWHGHERNFRYRATTESWDIPCPNVVPTPEMVTRLGQLGLPTSGLTFFDLVRARVAIDNNITSPSEMARVDRIVRSLMTTYPLRNEQNNQPLSDPRGGVKLNYAAFSPDLAVGLRMDLNMPFGNGYDDDGNGVVDDPGEFFFNNTFERLWVGSYLKSGGVSADLNRDGYLDDNDQRIRQEMAKQLFMLLMLMRDTNYVQPVIGVTDPQLRQELTIRRLAQFAVNAVDFRDRDSIMTCFEYDMEPFVDNDGDMSTSPYNPAANQIPGTWDVDGNPATVENIPTRRVVWGCEYPDLLLTETLSFHDRRVANTNRDASAAYYKQGDATHTDPHFDQVRAPQGSAFVELYCTGNPHNKALPLELYTFDSQEQEFKLHLGKTVRDGTGKHWPVWRLCVTSRYDNIPNHQNNLPQRFRQQPDTTSFDPGDRFSVFNRNASENPGGELEIDRIVTFASLRGQTNLFQAEFPDSRPDVYYYHGQALPTPNSNTAQEGRIYVKPGQYAVVGPHRRPDTGSTNTKQNITYLGYVAPSPTTGARTPAKIDLGELNNQGRVARPFKVTNIRGELQGPYVPQTANDPPIKPVIGISVAADNPNSSGQPVGFNITEPRVDSSSTYYQSPDSTTTQDDPIDGNMIMRDRYATPIDQPLDDGNAELAAGGSGFGDLRQYQRPGPGFFGRPGQTQLNYKSVLLQRLANPTKPWNPMPGEPGHRANEEINPYLTLDWMPFDVSVYNSSPPEQNAPARDEDYLTLPTLPPHKVVRFGTRQRGSPPRTPTRLLNASNQPGEQVSIVDLWKQPDWLEDDGVPGVNAQLETRPPLSVAVDPNPPQSSGNPVYTVTSNEWRVPLDHTLGYLNLPLQARPIETGTTLAHGWTAPRGSVPEPLFPDADLPNASSNADYAKRYLGDPWRPFAWLTWNNRPYANHMELLLVPAASPSRLLHEYDMRRWAYDPNLLRFWDHYTERDGAGDPTERKRLFGPPFGHLLNFFQSSQDPIGQSAGPNYFRLLEYVHVPSRFSGTQQMLGGLNMAAPWEANVRNTGVNAATDITQRWQTPRWPFTAPNNRLSAYREPGKVNLNTTSDNDINYNVDTGSASYGGLVWRALTNEYADLDYFGDQNLVASAAASQTPSRGTKRTGGRMWMDIRASREARDPRGADRSTAVNGTRDDLFGALNNQRFDPTQPAFYLNPFRSFAGGYRSVVPQQTTRYDEWSGSGHVPFRAVDSTMLRRREPTLNVGLFPTANHAWASVIPLTNPLFASDFGRYGYIFPLSRRGDHSTGYMSLWYNTSNPGPVISAAAPHQTTVPNTPDRPLNEFDTDFRNTDRNPFFRYQLYTKLGGLTTTRSNVYAIWITVGYFEVERINTDRPDLMQRYPEGYRLKRELGSDVGDVTRHRLFALFDRTIPVGFSRGDNLNVDRAIILKRIIE